MSNIETWDESAPNNDSAPPDGWPENMSRAAVNNAAREMMAALKRWYVAPEWLQLAYGFTVTEDDFQTIRIAGVDVTAVATAGRRVQISGGSTVYGTIVSSSFPVADTLIVVNVDPGTRAARSSTTALTFADAGPDTIAAASGDPWEGLVADDRIRVRDTASNDDVYRIASESGGTVVLEASEALTAEGPVSCSVYQEFGIVPAAADTILFHITAGARDSSSRDVGTDPGDVPSMSHLDPHVLKQEGTGQGLDADLVDGQHYSDIAADILAEQSIPDAIINGCARVGQRGALTLAKGVWGFGKVDRFEGKADTTTGVDAGILTQNESSSLGVAGYSVHFDGVTLTGGGGILYLRQRIEERTARQFIDGPGTFRVKVLHDKGSDVTFTITVRKADAADDFSATTEIGNNGGTVVTTGTETVLTFSIADMGACGNGIEIEIQAATGDIVAKDVEFTEFQFVPEATIQPFRWENIADVLSRCQRFFCKTFPYGTAPAQSAGFEGSLRATALGHNNGPHVTNTWTFPAGMRTDTPNVTPYSPDAGTTNWSGPYSPGSGISNIGSQIATVYGYGTDSGVYYIQLSAEDEL